MKKLTTTNPRELTAAIAVLVCCTGAAKATADQNNGTNAIAVPAQEFSLNYVSPLMKAIQLEKELERSVPSLVEPSIQPQKQSPNCFTGSVKYEAEHLSNGWSFNPPGLPAVTISVGKATGSFTAAGTYCLNGSWKATARPALMLKNELFME